jgi:hypothetical protein
VQFEEASRLDASMDASHHNILQALVDPVEWKTELERVGPKLRANQNLVTNEWRAHVDQTVSSKGHIEKILADTQGDLGIMNKYVQCACHMLNAVYMLRVLSMVCGGCDRQRY